MCRILSNDAFYKMKLKVESEAQAFFRQKPPQRNKYQQEVECEKRALDININYFVMIHRFSLLHTKKKPYSFHFHFNNHSP